MDGVSSYTIIIFCILLISVDLSYFTRSLYRIGRLVLRAVNVADMISIAQREKKILAVTLCENKGQHQQLMMPPGYESRT